MRIPPENHRAEQRIAEIVRHVSRQVGGNRIGHRHRQQRVPEEEKESGTQTEICRLWGFAADRHHVAE